MELKNRKSCLEKWRLKECYDGLTCNSFKCEFVHPLSNLAELEQAKLARKFMADLYVIEHYEENKIVILGDEKMKLKFRYKENKDKEYLIPETTVLVVFDAYVYKKEVKEYLRAKLIRISLSTRFFNEITGSFGIVIVNWLEKKVYMGQNGTFPCIELSYLINGYLDRKINKINIDSIKFEQMTTPELERLKQVEIDDFTLKYDDIERMTVPELTKKIKEKAQSALKLETRKDEELENWCFGKGVRDHVKNGKLCDEIETAIIESEEEFNITGIEYKNDLEWVKDIEKRSNSRVVSKIFIYSNDDKVKIGTHPKHSEYRNPQWRTFDSLKHQYPKLFEKLLLMDKKKKSETGKLKEKKELIDWFDQEVEDKLSNSVKDLSINNNNNNDNNNNLKYSSNRVEQEKIMQDKDLNSND